MRSTPTWRTCRPPRPSPRERPLTAVGPRAAWIDSVLEADLGAPRKQRHTARRVYVLMFTKKWSEGTAVGILDQNHPMLLGPNPFDTAWGSCNPGRPLS